MLSLKVLPCLVKLTAEGAEEIATRTHAISTLGTNISSQHPNSLSLSLSLSAAYLSETELCLQELAADSDHLVSSLVRCVATPPDLNNDLVLDCHVQQFEGLCAAIFLLLGSLASNKEEIRCRISTQPQLMPTLAKALHSENFPLKIAASR